MVLGVDLPHLFKFSLKGGHILMKNVQVTLKWVYIFVCLIKEDLHPNFLIFQLLKLFSLQETKHVPRPNFVLQISQVHENLGG